MASSVFERVASRKVSPKRRKSAEISGTQLKSPQAANAINPSSNVIRSPLSIYLSIYLSIENSPVEIEYLLYSFFDVYFVFCFEVLYLFNVFQSLLHCLFVVCAFLFFVVNCLCFSCFCLSILYICQSQRVLGGPGWVLRTSLRVLRAPSGLPGGPSGRPWGCLGLLGGTLGVLGRP